MARFGRGSLHVADPEELCWSAAVLVQRLDQRGVVGLSDRDLRSDRTELGLSPDAADDDAVVYFHDVPPDVREDAIRRGEPEQSRTPMTQPWPLDTWPDVPTWVLIGRDDRLFPAGFQRRVALERLGVKPDEVEGGHLAALSRPDALVERIDA